MNVASCAYTYEHRESSQLHFKPCYQKKQQQNTTTWLLLVNLCENTTTVEGVKV